MCTHLLSLIIFLMGWSASQNLLGLIELPLNRLFTKVAGLGPGFVTRGLGGKRESNRQAKAAACSAPANALGSVHCL